MKPLEHNAEEPAAYQVLVKGHLGSHWANWFDGLDVAQKDDGHTLIIYPAADQAALHGLLKKIRDLGLPLVSVIQLPAPGTHRTPPNDLS